VIDHPKAALDELVVLMASRSGNVLALEVTLQFTAGITADFYFLLDAVSATAVLDIL